MWLFTASFLVALQIILASLALEEVALNEEGFAEQSSVKGSRSLESALKACLPISHSITSFAEVRSCFINQLQGIERPTGSPGRVVESFRRLGQEYIQLLGVVDTKVAQSNEILANTMEQFSYYRKSEEIQSSTKLILCVSHYQEHLGWLNFLRQPFVVASKTIVDSRILHVPVNQGNEVSSYLKYILELYDSLPEWTLFLHGHYEDWHQLYPIELILNSTTLLERSYRNINNYLVSDRNTNSNRYMQQLQQLWPTLFQEELGDMPLTFREKCCAQFVVHRDRIRLRSRAFYQRLYDYVIADSQNDAGSVDGYHTSMSYVVEFVWHYIFGEPAVLDYPDEPYVQLTEDIIVYV